MYRRPSKRAQFVRRMIVYVVMLFSIIAIASTVLLFVLGFRFDGKHLEQGALLQFNTRPTGAWVRIDDQLFGSQTPSKSSVAVGGHTVTMGRDGYNTWKKTVDVKAGTLTWLDYALLVPTSRPVDEVLGYQAIVSALPSPSKRAILIQQDRAQPSFDLVDIRDITVRTSPITLTAEQYSEASIANVSHAFTVDRWDSQGRYVIINHTYGQVQEWLVVDTENPENVRNINAVTGGSVASPRFSGNSGQVLYALIDGNLRRVNLGSGAISDPLAESVVSFDIYSDTLTYIAADTTQPGTYYAASITPDDESAYVYGTSTNLEGFAITTARYYNNNYVAVSKDSEISVFKGRYPQSVEDASAMMAYGTVKLQQPLQALSFSPEGNYLTAQTNKAITTYEIEHRKTMTFAVEADAGNIPRLTWLTSAYLAATIDGQLTIREFDGLNGHKINASANANFEASLSVNGRYMYSIGQKTDGTFSLQRVRMILN